ncbi:hypothetical protein pb186bvf_014413 [Paramecium bursaria]
MKIKGEIQNQIKQGQKKKPTVYVRISGVNINFRVALPINS